MKVMNPLICILSVLVIVVVWFSHECHSLANQRDTRKSTDSVIIPSEDDPQPETVHFETDRISSAQVIGFIKEDGTPEPRSLVMKLLMTYLPACPKGYRLTISEENKPQFDLRNCGLNMKDGQYNMCTRNGKAHLTECTESSTRTTCAVGREFILNDIQSSSRRTSTIANKVSSGSTSNVIDDTLCRPASCSAKQLMAINMKNPVDCESFYICIMGQHFLLKCPESHQFSEEYGVCLEKVYANCRSNPACLTSNN